MDYGNSILKSMVQVLSVGLQDDLIGMDRQ